MCQKETLLAFFFFLEPHDLYAILTKPFCVYFFFLNKGGDFTLCKFPWSDYNLFHGTGLA